MAIRANASGDYVRRTTGLPDPELMSICFWVRLRTDLNTFSPIWLLGRAASGTYIQFGTNSDGTTLVWEDQRPASSDKFFSMMNMTVGTWYFVAGNTAGPAGTNRAYWADAATAALSSGSVSMSGTSAHDPMTEMSFFAETLFAGRSDAAVAGVKIWSGAQLSQAEFELERWSYLPQRTANLHMWSPFVDVDETNFTDYSGNGRNWTEAGSITFEDGPPIGWGAPDDSRIYIPAAGEPGSFVPAWARNSNVVILGAGRAA
jgi:hypothetical protein